MSIYDFHPSSSSTGLGTLPNAGSEPPHPFKGHTGLWASTVLAPMDGVTDLAMRLWLALVGAPPFAVTPFLRVTSDYPTGRIPLDFCPPEERDLGLEVRPQLMGSCPATLARFANHLLQTHDTVDINMGCPAPRVVGHSGGSALIRCHASLSAFMDRLFDRVPPGRVSIKTRLGFDSADEADNLVGILVSFPLAELTLHGRTRSQRYGGRADWPVIGRLAADAPVSVAGSGDVTSVEKLQEVRRLAPCARRIFIGRGLLRNPWMSHEVAAGGPVRIPLETLIEALRCFVLVNQILMPKRLDHLTIGPLIRCLAGIRQDLFKSGCNSMHQQYWQTIRQFLELERNDLDATASASCSRLKMLWSYLFTSLPGTLNTTSLLRARSAAEFFEELSHAAQESSHCGASEIQIRANPEWDWRFAGQGRRNVTNLAPTSGEDGNP